MQDERIDEVSGMVDLGSRTVLTNDSGDAARLFVLDGSGRTVAVREYAAPAVDVEALAPAGDRSEGAVWVGDVGDNRGVRESVTVTRVPLDGGAVASYELTYPDGPVDAESLLVDPDGRLVVVTKAFAGGAVMRAPARLDATGPNRLEQVATVGEALATDAALLSPTRVLVRGYAEAGLYAWPSWEPVRRVPLPEQPQGEALSVGPGGRVRVASEGAGEPVRQLPASATADPAAVPQPSVSPSPSASPNPVPNPTSATRDDGVDRLALGTGLLLGGVGLAAVTWLVQRRRARPGGR
ncbi:hypothetical protein [Nocardioides aurantiacus]|uniref:hypothetical protein n=1 Tax=Nocardioides aurantiacus TaxID=86796 RepID=UPI000F46AF46|nr:hypothetical protein [Nocardioides aurantiacus]